MKKAMLTACVLCAATGIGATAAEPVMLDGMVITATRTLQEAQRVPAVVTVITKKIWRNGPSKRRRRTGLYGRCLSGTGRGRQSGIGPFHTRLRLDGYPGHD